MAELDPTPRISPLAQAVTRNGRAVQIDIYENSEGGWLLEVVDEYGNSTVWDDSFASDREALDEALKTIDEDGIDSLIGAPPGGREGAELDQSLSEAALNELEDFLADESIEETSMDVSTLEGFLTAIVIGPQTVMPSRWLPWVWDREKGQAEAVFDNLDQANRIMNLLMGFMNGIAHAFMDDPPSFEPIYWRGGHWGAAEWCEGFLLGTQFDEDAWSSLWAGKPQLATPFLRLGTDDGLEITRKANDADRWMDAVEPALVEIHAFWRERRASQPMGLAGDDFPLGGRRRVVQVIREGPKVGRNDPCPCGSGKKYKKCCGASSGSPTLH